MSDAPERVPPRDFDAEQAVLGSMLLEPGAAARAFAIVGAEDFYWDDHQIVCRAMVACGNRNEPVDLVTVSAELRRSGQLDKVGGGTYLTGLISQVPTAAHVVRYANIVAEKAVLRNLIGVFAEGTAACYENPEDVLTVTNMALEGIHRTVEVRLKGQAEIRTAPERATDIQTAVAIAEAGRRPLSTVRMGISGLDETLGPLADHRLVLIKGKQGTGKTHILVNAIVNSAKEILERDTGEQIVVFSFESPGMYDLRTLAYLSGIDNNEIRRGFDGARNPAQRDRLDAAKDAIISPAWPVSILEEAVSEDTIEAKLRRFSRTRRVGLVAVDFWQAAGTRWGRSRVEELDNMALRFRGLAEEFACPFLIASQATVNPATGEIIAKGSRAVEDYATLAIRLMTDAKDKRKHWLECDKCRIGGEFGRLSIHMDKALSHIHEVAEEYGEEPTGRRGGRRHDE